MSALHDEARALAALLPQLGERLLKFAEQVDEISEAIFRHEAVRREFLKTAPSKARGSAPAPQVTDAARKPAQPKPEPAADTDRITKMRSIAVDREQIQRLERYLDAASLGPFFRSPEAAAKWPEARRALMLVPANGGRPALEMLALLNALPGTPLTVKDVHNRRRNGFPAVAVRCASETPAASDPARTPALPTPAPAADTDRIATMRAIAAKMASAGKPQPAPGAPPMKAIAADREQIRSFAARKGWPVQPFDLVAINARCRGVGLPEFVLRAP